MVFVNVVFHKKLPHRGDEEGSPIRSTRVILPTFLTRKKEKKNNPSKLQKVRSREQCILLDMPKVSELPWPGVKPL